MSSGICPLKPATTRNVSRFSGFRRGPNSASRRWYPSTVPPSGLYMLSFEIGVVLTNDSAANCCALLVFP
jgi:hypothetical protein